MLRVMTALVGFGFLATVSFSGPVETKPASHRRVPAATGILKKETVEGICIPPVTLWKLVIVMDNGKESSWALNFGDNEKLLKLAKRLEGKKVTAIGQRLLSGTILVSGLIELRMRIVPSLPKQLAERLVGKTLSEANGIARDHGYTTRVVQIDGRSFPVTSDLRPDRINLTWKNGKVIGAAIG